MASGRAVKAGIWSTVDLVVRLVVSFVTSIILARILTPADFGIFALVMFFVMVSQVLVDRGLATALIQGQAESADQKNALFWTTLTIAAVMAVAIGLMAPSFAAYFRYPVLQPLLYVCAGIVVVSALASVPTAILQRELRFEAIAKTGLVSSSVSAVAAVVAALYGAGVWSFAIQAGAYSVINSALIWIRCDWRPGPWPRFGEAALMLRFGSFVTLSSLMDVVYMNAASLIIGRLHGAADLGFFNRAQNLQNLPGNILAAIVTRVALPLFSAQQHDHDALRRGVRLVQGAIMLVNLPLMVAMVVMPDLIVGFLYGAKWLSTAPLLAIMAFGGVLFPLQIVNMQLVLSQGRSGLSFKVEAIKKLIGLIAIFAGSAFGLTGVAIGLAASIYLGYAINAGVAGRMIGYRPLAQLRDLVGVLAASLVMGVAIAALRWMLSPGTAAELFILTGWGMLVYASVVLLARVGVTDELVALTPVSRFIDRIPRLRR
ncbi:lipopolysaccharide biosynthesis protein [Sphingomonas sp. FW199]|uniref:lipopolysaccharide biosynthesis protein n=1 Tax=Sphingomonas sp. FW199 TaxID=3400217 RepID=UPI003CF37294